MEHDGFALREGEELLWQGRPPGGVIFRTYDIFFVPFSIIWTGFAIFWTLIVYLELAPKMFGGGKLEPEAFAFLIIGPLFVIVGLTTTFGRFVFDRNRRVKTRYAVTNKRAIILKKGESRAEIDSIPITRSLRVKVNGSQAGNIIFGEGYGFFSYLTWAPQSFGPPHPFIFERIQGVRVVYDLILEIQDRSPV
ncbi:MAG: hypothetical protein A3E78_02965 [Alphaproteobacteria bacterium RIFCSPHIGHO2_12_FULL_63_12]|nr:MAG: hypothetical protein A3E78_02965 [Alphaproteobacteria bacterium RIFCSPHIGHO2_12_FULL_63_12]